MRAQFTWKRFFESKLFFVVGIGLLLLFSVNLTRAQWRDRAIRDEIEKLQTEADAFQKEKDAHETLLSLLQTSEFLEKEARQTLGYAKPGEQVVVIEKNAKCKIENLQCDEDGGVEKSMSNPRKWWVYFFGKI